MKAKFVDGEGTLIAMEIEPETDEDRLLIKTFAHQASQHLSKLWLNGWRCGGPRSGFRGIQISIAVHETSESREPDAERISREANKAADTVINAVYDERLRIATKLAALLDVEPMSDSVDGMIRKLGDGLLKALHEDRAEAVRAERRAIAAKLQPLLKAYNIDDTIDELIARLRDQQIGLANAALAELNELRACIEQAHAAIVARKL